MNSVMAFYAEALRAHLGSLATRAGLGTISHSLGIARFIQGGVVETFHWPANNHGAQPV